MIESLIAATALLVFFNWKFSFISFDSNAFHEKPAIEAKPEQAKLAIPEDSTLRRHFLSKLRYEIEATLPPKPLESGLLAHHQSIIESRLERVLAGLPIDIE